MKTNKIRLYQWHAQGQDIDIDWPRVHGAVGAAQIEWLLNLRSDQCQLTVDRCRDELTLTAEFYSEQLLTMYHLMWAK